MPSYKEDFKISGPVYLSSINWRNSDHQRIVMASLVNATYVLEKDRQEGRVGPRALAPAWWQYFNFECTRTLKDDRKIFGCIYELKPASRSDPYAPRFVVTFRGTMLNRSNFLQDAFLNFHVVFGGINKTTRFLTALDTICDIIRSNCSDARTIWVGGHSLGASIATVAGKFMAKQDIHLNTFLFNPPYAAIPLDLIPLLDDKLKEHLRTYKATLNVVVAIGMEDYRTRKHTEFLKLALWTPYLFVNLGDPICAGYKSYFERHQKMMEAGIMGHIRRVESYTAIREMSGELLGFELELSHKLPSAKLAVNLEKSRGWRKAHGILQWWQRDVSLGVSDHHYKPDTS